MGVIRRERETVSPLELFFDLVFVLAITQCTALMANDETWRGIGRGLVVLGLLWWSWVVYAWLTSVVDPDEGGVRVVLFAAMAALLVTSLCVPHVFGENAVIFAAAYGAVRAAHIVLFVLASRDDPGLRHSVLGLGASTAVAVGVLVTGALVHGNARLGTWLAALVFDMVGPMVIDASGWRLVPGHFAERHGLIVIVALGESIVAIGVGAGAHVDGGVIATAILGSAVAGALWWTYFDVSALAAARRLAEVESVEVRNRLARDAFSYLHLPMVAAIVLIALGMRNTLAAVGTPLSWPAATALVGGAALYLLAHVAFKLRTLASFGVQRLAASVALLAFVPVAHRVDPLVSIAVVAAVSWAMLGVEGVRYAEARRAIRHAGHRHA